MKRFRRAYLLIAALAAAGCILVLLDRAEYDAAAAFQAAVECADTNSDHCVQTYPGAIQYVRVAQTTSGEQDQVDITSRGVIEHVALLPSPSQAPLVRVGATVMVEWYTGSIATVWIAGSAIPTTSNLAAGHADVGFIGAILIWLAAMFGALMLVNRRMAADLAAAFVLPSPGQVLGLGAQGTVLPGGSVGWVIRPRLREAFFLPLGLALLALISIRPFTNPDTRLLAVAGDAIVFVPLLVHLVLELRNSRILVDRSSIRKVDWLGRIRSWPVTEIDVWALGGIRWSGWLIPVLILLGRDGSELFTVTSLGWRLDELGAAFLAVGIPLTLEYEKVRRVNWTRRAFTFLITLPSLALLVLSFLPLPPSNS